MKNIRAEKKISFKKFVEISWFSFKMFIRPNPEEGILVLVLEIFGRISGVINVFVVAKVIDMVAGIISNKGSIDAVMPYVWLLVGFQFLFGMIWVIRWYFSAKAARAFSNYEKVYYFEKYRTIGVPVMEDPEKNDAVHRSQQEIMQIQSLSYYLIGIIGNIVSLLVSGFIIFKLMPFAVIAMVSWMILGKTWDLYFAKKVYAYNFNITEEVRKNRNIFNYVITKISLLELNTHNATDFIKNKYTNFINSHLDGWSKIRRERTTVSLTMEFCNMFLLFWVYINIIRKIIFNQLSIGKLYFYINMVERLMNNLNGLFDGLLDVYESALKADDVYSFFLLKPAFEDGKQILKTFKAPPEICFNNVNFRYPYSDKFILKDFNLKIKPGEKIAIVGVNGAGKTTLTKLLLRYYQTTDGEIMINNKNIDDVKIESFYKNVGILFQDFSSFGSFTVKENIFLGDTLKPLNKQKLMNAAKRADIDEFVNAYPNKYDQMLGEGYTGGIRPSTGQWQRIAISRLFYRNPWLVIFDEPTASIDAEAEYKIFNNIYNFFENKTVIIISHRFSTVRNADRIILIDEGKIAEEGSHEELIKLDGKYAKAFRLQAEGYEIKS